MKKRRTGILLAVILLAAFALMNACGKTGQENYLTPEETEATDKLTKELTDNNSEETDQNIVPEEESDPETEYSAESDTAEVTELQSESAPGGEMAVHFLDVGQGLSILVQSGGQTLIYDGGSRNASSFVVSYLKKQEVSTIDYLISSHYDEDHVSGLIGCLNAFNVKNVICADYVHDSGLYQSFVDTVASLGLKAQHPAVGTTFSFGTGSFTILAPREAVSGDSNENSVAIRLTNGSNHFVFTGDAQSGSEADMIQSGLDLTCDVLCLGHHGSASSSSAAFLMATQPDYAVISCGADNSYGHPDDLVMEYLSSMELPLFRTDKQGTIIACSDGTVINWNVEPCNDYTPGDYSDSETAPQNNVSASDSSETVSEPVSEPASGNSYVLNTNTHKFHYPFCYSAAKIKDKNRQDYVGTRDELISMGYDPCGNCNP